MSCASGCRVAHHSRCAHRRDRCRDERGLRQSPAHRRDHPRGVARVAKCLLISSNASQVTRGPRSDERPARFRLGFRGCGWNKNAGSATGIALFQPHRQGILRQAGAYLISRGRSTLSVRCSRRGDVADALRRPRRTCVFFPPSLASLGEKSRLRRPSDRRARGALEASVRASRRLSIDDLAPNVSLASFARGRCVRRLAEEPAPPALDMRQGFIIDRIAGLGLTSPSPLASPSQDAA